MQLSSKEISSGNDLSDIEVLRRGLSDEGCGCPEEELVILNTHVTIHLEPDGSGHAFYDSGDWQEEELFADVTTIPELRIAAKKHLEKLYGI
ncbi:hypothetical protein [Litoribrevibacter albus]|uniref:Uncharacterized protein n=1 Tax=Litoribrevibacter albus TaxID=1473156 RepID=A0AA37W609_9GAMM|nr:hypothetical protein [Litoribrevibacter albus]GLQ31647.1 hypothetical protein GCM10007876_21260 [Litoribrevibacter albus]